MGHLVIVACQVDVQLVVVVVPHQLQHKLVIVLLLHKLTDHVGVDKLVDLLHRNVHAVIRRDVTLQLQEVPTNIVDVDEGKLFMDVVLGDVDVEVVEPILIYARIVGSGSHVTCHGIRNEG